MGVALGQKIGLTDAQLTDLQLLCLLHDIGKIGVPLEILNKPGKLTDEEWKVLQTHPDKGYQIAITTDDLKPIADMILTHHEHWDGHGYPKKLVGKNIPVLSRIISIVDAYDAMVNDRCYRKALSPETAQEEIRKYAGSQFDPELAADFLELLSENPDIAVGEVTGGKIESLMLPVGQVALSGNAEPIKYSKYLLNADNIIIEVDDQFEKITGYSSEEVIGKKSQFDLIPSEERDFYMLQVQNQLDKENIAYLRHELVTKDGTVMKVVCFGQRYFDSAVKALRSEIFIFTG